MGFTKIYKQTSAELCGPGYADQYGSVIYSSVPLTYKDMNGLSHTGFIPYAPVGSGSTVPSYWGRTPLLASHYTNNVTNNYTINTPSSNSTIYSSTTSIFFGYGTSAESEDDYKLDAPYTYNVHFTGTTPTTIYPYYDSVSGKIKRGQSFTITATTSLNITEIGLGVCVFRSRSSSTSYNFTPTVLMYRKVLATPIVVPAGTTTTLSIEIASY